MLIFEKTSKGRCAAAQFPQISDADCDLPKAMLRADAPALPEVSELDVVRHFTRLSQKNFSIDTQLYPLGSCTMKYNPKVCHTLAMLPGYLSRHPATGLDNSQGFMACMHDLQEMLRDASGMHQVSLSPMAGAQGEFAGIAMIRAYHDDRKDDARTEIIIPDAAHGTNPATAVMCGYKVKEIPTKADGDMDIEALKAMVGPQTAGIMLTNPSTLGVFERQILEIADIIHKVGGLLYYDGANLNAILGKARPGDMGFDVVHINLHKTFSTPHGGGGPGAGPVGVSQRLAPYLPVPLIIKKGERYAWQTEDDCPKSIGRLSAHMGNAGVLLRALIYMKLLGKQGMQRVAEFSTLNANYLMSELKKHGFDVTYKDRRATHEFIVSFKKETKEKGVKAMDIAKRLLDYDMHAPTTYFPLLVPECFLIEPTETESKGVLDEFVSTLVTIRDEALQDPDTVKNAPYNTPARRLDDVKAVKELNIKWIVQGE